MCTAISFRTKDSYFGRNLDLERGYKESVVVTPRNYEFKMRCKEPITKHYAMIGMAAVEDGYPLYFEATNEHGVSMAGLNFLGNAVYAEPRKSKDNITPFELIPWILGDCANLVEVKRKLENLQLVGIHFSEQLPLSPLHWMVSDKDGSLVIESVNEGLKIYDNPYEVLTNNPPFEYHAINLSNYMGLDTGMLETHFKEKFPLVNYSLGMGALGLPGDFSSVSRFVRAFFVKENSVVLEGEEMCVNQFFHILNTVAMPKGCVWTPHGCEYTRYSSCCNVDKGIYYYTTYENFEIRAVSMKETDLDGTTLITYKVKEFS